MAIEKPEDIDEVLDALDRAGDLDSGNIEDGILQLHEVLLNSGANPEDPTNYRAIIAVGAIIASLPPLLWVPMTEELIRVSMRALRDLRNRGGS